jgi:peroxisomal 2,4-dienoyl-CoA reductase
MDAPFIFKPDTLKGKVAFVTGGASGIGYGVSTRLAMAGADLIIASRRVEKCKEVAAEMTSKFGVRAIGKQLDVRSSELVNQVMKESVEEMGKLDILVNNSAGNFYYPSHMLTDNMWNAVVGIDLFGTFYCSRAAFPYLKDNGGLIVSTSMTLHYTGWVGMAPACAAKAGIDALTRTFALEWGRFNIRVNAIAPGPIITEGVEKAFAAGGSFEDWKNEMPIKRSGQPHEIGDLIVYMASPAASWMTGSIVVLDGGEWLSARRAGLDPEALEQMAPMLRSKK